MRECEDQPVLMQQTGQNPTNNTDNNNHNKLLPAKVKTTSHMHFIWQILNENFFTKAPREIHVQKRNHQLTGASSAVCLCKLKQ